MISIPISGRGNGTYRYTAVLANTKGETTLAPKGATGWGVLTLDRLIRNRFEQG